MIRKLPVLVLVVGLVASCGSDGKPKAEETPAPTATTSATPTPTPTPTPAPTQTLKPVVKPTKTIKPAPVLSACATVWKPGKVLPSTYSGCPTQDGEEAYAPEPCNTGGMWATYSGPGGRYVAVLGGPIYKRDPNADGNYESTYEGCTGEG